MKHISLVVLLVVASCEKKQPPEKKQPAGDPARIDGTWDYRTESNCGTAGTGHVTFQWQTDLDNYREDGVVTWPETKLTIKWWGDAIYDAKSRTLAAEIENDLGDRVAGVWKLERDRMTIEWSQTNGCRGVGTATRRK